jgi:DNA-binding transcriptional LysR family regulator
MKTDPIKPDELHDQEFIDSGITKNIPFRELLGPSKFDVPSITTLLAMLRSNIGVSILPSLAIPKADEYLRSRAILPSEKRNICLITRLDWTQSPAAEAMIETILSEMPSQIALLGLSPPDIGT